MSGGPILVCYDGSDDAKRAVERAGELFAGRRTLVLHVWEPLADVADAIVVGRRGVSSAELVILGSVANAVVHHADRPVVVVPTARD
jgi:nucleotide-binding universal stress UspA family protein